MPRTVWGWIVAVTVLAAGGWIAYDTHHGESGNRADLALEPREGEVQVTVQVLGGRYASIPREFEGDVRIWAVTGSREVPLVDTEVKAADLDGQHAWHRVVAVDFCGEAGFRLEVQRGASTLLDGERARVPCTA